LQQITLVHFLDMLLLSVAVVVALLVAATQAVLVDQAQLDNLFLL
jgi:hypothetical protein